jgi:hypothetical protein
MLLIDTVVISAHRTSREGGPVAPYPSSSAKASNSAMIMKWISQ